ncbi:MAG: glycosyltransferase family 39 protein [Armatimonadota bacterium]
MKEYRIFNIPLIVYIFILALFLRLYNLGLPSIWVDEAFSIWVAKFDMVPLVQFIAKDAHPPLYFMLLHFWVKLFGTGEFAVRLLSVLFSMGSLCLIYAVSNVVFTDKKYGLLASFLFAISSFSITGADTDVKMYSMLTFLTILSVYFLCRIIKEAKPYLWILYTLTLMLALYTHYFAFFVIFAELVCIILFYRDKKGTDENANNNMWPGIRPAVIIGLIMLVSFIPWVKPFFDQSFIFDKGEHLPKATFFHLANLFYYFFTPILSKLDSFFAPFAHLAISFVFILSFILMVLGGVKLSKYKSGIVLLVSFLIILLLPFLVSCMAAEKHVFQARYMTLVFPLFTIIFTCGILSLENRYLKYILIAGFIFSNLIFYYLYTNNSDYWKQNWRTVVSYVEEKSRPGDVVFLQVSYNALPFNYYYKGGAFKLSAAQKNTGIPEWRYNFSYTDEYLLKGGLPQYHFDSYDPAFLNWAANLHNRIIYILNIEEFGDPDRKVLGWLSKNCIFLEGIEVVNISQGQSRVTVGIFETKTENEKQ